jgi:hypothetical protein
MVLVTLCCSQSDEAHFSTMSMLSPGALFGLAILENFATILGCHPTYIPAISLSRSPTQYQTGELL